jgi:hypothetical protein
MDKLAGRRKRGGKPKPHPLIAPQETEMDYDAPAVMGPGSPPTPPPTSTFPRRGKTVGKPGRKNAGVRRGGNMPKGAY